MISEPLIFVGAPDLSGKLRGKAFPAADRERRFLRGMGWVPTNAQITCFDTIAESPYGSFGDLLLVPDPTTEVRVDFEDGSAVEHFAIGNLLTLDGAPWELCTRAMLRAALARLDAVAGLTLRVAFEHEFHIRDLGRPVGDAFSLDGLRAMDHFPAVFTAAQRAAGLVPDSFVKEYGPDQYEVTTAPQEALRAADEAVILRQMARATGHRLARPVGFTPLRAPDVVGNGVHIHFSLWDRAGRPVTHDTQALHGLSAPAGAFAAGILRHMAAMVAITAPSVVSYARLTPHRWSASYNNLGVRDREAGLRLCPTTSQDPVKLAEQYNLEYRAADAAATPHLALAALVMAGTRGIEDGLDTPMAVEEDLSLQPEAALHARGVVRLPTSLQEALAAFAAEPDHAGWFGAEFRKIYALHKAEEIAFVGERTPEDVCALYDSVY